MKHRESFFIRTIAKYQFIDITDKVKEVVKNSKIVNGEGKVRVYHTTTTLILNENEHGLLKDILNMFLLFETILKKTVGRLLFLGFHHDDMKKRRKREPKLPRGECENALAHLLAILIGFFEISFEVIGSQIDLGTWQRILFIEFDEKPKSYKERRIGVRIISDEEGNKKEAILKQFDCGVFKCTCGGH